MNPAPNEQEIFAAALLCDPAERAGRIAVLCGGDEALRLRVEALLRAAEVSGDFLELPPAGLPEQAASLPVDDLGEKPGDRIGRYKLLEKIGEGGCGIVYMADQEEPVKRRVALKVIRPGMDSRGVIARFEAERQALALMDHANIARVFDGGCTPSGRPYFVMELVRGVPITAFCDEARLPMEERLRLFLLICRAVQHAHQKGIIHRDLKPSNILVTVNDGVAVPKVIDFGIAKATGQRLTDKSLFTQFHTFIGTPAYTSPEQAEMSSVDIDTRSDIYSLGVLLYELLTSRTPFDGEELLRSGLDEMRRIIRTEDPPRPSNRLGTLDLTEATSLSVRRKTSVPEMVGAIRGDLDWIVMKCLEKDRARRYDTAGSLAADVECHLENEPIAARPPSRLYRLRKLLRRNKGTFTALAAIALVLCAGTFVSISQAMRARENEARANAALAELQASSPLYAAQARDLAAKGRFGEAMEKLDGALRLWPASTEFLLAKAAALECQLRFGEAGAIFRKVCELDPNHLRARSHLALCGQLAAPARGDRPKEWFDALSRLYVMMMDEESRFGEEIAGIAQAVLEESRKRLHAGGLSSRFNPKNLFVGVEGYLYLDLRDSGLADISALKGVPLRVLEMRGCPATDLTPLSESPLCTFSIAGTKISDLRPLRGMRTLKRLSAVGSAVADLSPLEGLSINWLDLTGTPVEDLTPLRGMALNTLRIGGTRVGNLEPLSGMPLTELECFTVPAIDFTPLAGCRDLIYLRIHGTSLSSLEALRDLRLRYFYFEQTHVSDLSPLAGMPLVSVSFYETPVVDITPLGQCSSLEAVVLSEGVVRLEALKTLTTLRRLSYRGGRDGQPDRTAVQFWKEREAGK